ncbi:MAG TPA: phosphoadenylyl-sulfate reductase [Beijerinckiaceae bacterium]|jgi:phosphoadenosine phosphosulfate reductase|nr:phosphoadenylyl-sulfate reductase [Beijerinckiaceae bacterium]
MSNPRITLAAHLDESFRALDTLERLRLLCDEVGGRIVFTSSLGIEDQALTHLILANDLPIEVVTLDTGRLFTETYKVWAETEARYGRRIRAYYPRHDALEELVAHQGIDGFYDSVAARHACCDVRKVEPLKRALEGASVWITGLRAGQSAGRSAVGFVAFDSGHGVLKANPLLDWERERLTDFIAENHVPVNALHAKGFPSIGCAPCTRAVAPGESERAGRWWWENEDQKECGLHVDESGRLVRAKAPAVAEGPFR